AISGEGRCSTQCCCADPGSPKTRRAPHLSLRSASRTIPDQRCTVSRKDAHAAPHPGNERGPEGTPRRPRPIGGRLTMGGAPAPSCRRLPCKSRPHGLARVHRHLAGQSGRSASARFVRWRTFRTLPNIDNRARRRALARPGLKCTYSEKDISMITGTVKFYNGQRGFGFIKPDDGSQDVFVHATALERAGMRGLAGGQKVSFDTEADRRTGKTAVANIQAA